MSDDPSIRAGIDAEHRRHEQNIATLFDNEKFVISVVQVVAGGSLFAVVAQIKNLQELASLLAIYCFITLLTLALALAVVAAFCKHQYKLWDVKLAALSGAATLEEASRRHLKTARYLAVMRWTMAVSVVMTVAAFVLLACAFWSHYLFG